MRERSISFTTRKRNRVFRRSSKRNGATHFANDYTFRVKQDGKSHFFNLGPDKRQAGPLADKISDYLKVEGNTAEEAHLMFSKSHREKAVRNNRREELGVPLQGAAHRPATVQMISSRYEEVTSHLSPFTIRGNLTSLRRFAAGILGLPKLGKGRTKDELAEWREKTGSFPLSGFTNQAVEKFRQRELTSVKEDFEKLGAMTASLNSYLRGARSIFFKKLLHHYEDLNLPDPIPFQGIDQLQEPSHRYRSKIDIIKLMKLAKNELKPEHPEEWIVFLLSIGVGLRRNEIDKLALEQIDSDNRRIWIKTTPYFRPKSRSSEAYVDVGPGIMEEIEAYSAQHAPVNAPFLLPGPPLSGDRLRCQSVLKSLYAWLRSHGVDEIKPLHTLRKEAGSMLFQSSGSLLKVSEFLRNDIQVAREHYVGRKERIEIELPGL